MLNINTYNTKNALKCHLNGLKNEIPNRIKSQKPKAKLTPKNYEKLSYFLTKNIKEILAGDQMVLLELHQKLIKLKLNKKKLVHDLNLVLSYDWYRDFKKNKYNGFVLAKNLGIETCPYCNRNYTTSTRIDKKSKSIFPAFDHFLPKDKFPLLAISFYNLIPTCTICNTRKSNDNPIEKNIIYPYSRDNLTAKFSFKVIPKSVSVFSGKFEDFSLDISNDSSLSNSDVLKINDTIEYFDIKEILESNHSDLVKEIIWKSISYNDTFRKYLKNTFGFSEDEIFKLVFETYFEEDRLVERPFSKLKRDIYLDLNK